MRRRVTPTARVAWLLPTLSATAVLACNPPKLDQDGDGFTELTGDCDDLDANVHPDAQEVCYNGIDDNCNGVEDEEGATSGRVWYADTDGDGYGQNAITLNACTQPEGYTAEKWDCHDNDPTIHPAATETCDAIDNDCDGQIDESSAEGSGQWMKDLDGDGYGDDSSARYSCEDLGEGWTQTGGDCNDSDPLINPDQRESCFSSGDDNCDGVYNEADAYGCTPYYADADGDGFPGTEACLCAPDDAYSATESTDCDDENPDRYPGSPAPDAGWRVMDCDQTVDIEIDDADLSFQTSTSTQITLPETLTGGDLDGDGLADIVIGAHSDRSGWPSYVAVAGSAAGFENQHDLSTSAHAVLWSLDTSTDGHEVVVHTSESGAVVVDINGDGYDDLLTPQQILIDEARHLEVAVFLGPVSGTLDWPTADATYRNAEALSPTADGLFTAGDHPDGRALVAMGDYAASRGASMNQGSLDYIGWDSARTALVQVEQVWGREENQYYGAKVSSLGDMNGDGLDDRVVTSLGYSTGDAFDARNSRMGRVLSIYSDPTKDADTHIVSNLYYQSIVEDLGGPGDLNGDGHPDLAFAPSWSNIGTVDSGRTHVVWGPLPEGVVELVDLPQVVLIGDDRGQAISCPTVLGDTDGDGRADLALGARVTTSDDPPRMGATYVWLGHDTTGTHTVGEATARIQGSRESDAAWQGTCYWARSAHASPGDINGDGLHDLVIRGSASSTRDPDGSDTLFTFFGRGE